VQREKCKEQMAKGKEHTEESIKCKAQSGKAGAKRIKIVVARSKERGTSGKAIKGKEKSTAKCKIQIPGYLAKV
jgi:hypothetical protein